MRGDIQKTIVESMTSTKDTPLTYARVTLFLAAIAVTPAAGRFGELPLPLSDLFLMLSICLFLPQFFGKHHLRHIIPLLGPVLPWLLCVAFALLGASSIRLAIPEFAQVVLYCAAALCISGWIARYPIARIHLRAALRVGLVLAFMGVPAWTFAPSGLFQDVFGTRYGLMASLLCLCGVHLVVEPGEPRVRLVATATIALLAATWLAWSGSAEATTRANAFSIPQRYVETYAALSVLSDHPLWGLGPGNYQSQIGPYYQGLPKENTMEPGSQIGLAVLLASFGLAGVFAVTYWFTSLWHLAVNGDTLCARIRCALILFLLASCLTPIVTAIVLLPFAVLHGFVLSFARPNDE